MDFQAAINTAKQYARALTGDNVVIGDVIRINASAGGGHAVVLHINGQTMHVTGFYTDGTRYHDFVQMADARHATPYQINKLVEVAQRGIEWELICREIAANAQEAQWQGMQTA